MVVLVNRATVARYFPNHQVIGAQLRFWGMEREIVGIVEDEKIYGLTDETPPAMYVSTLQAPQTGRATLMVRTTGDPMLLAEPLRAARQPSWTRTFHSTTSTRWSRRWPTPWPASGSRRCYSPYSPASGC